MYLVWLMVVLDLGCGTYCRGDIGIDVQFTYRNPYDQPWKFDRLMGGKRSDCIRIMADIDNGIPLRDRSVEKVVMRDVLEHLRHPYNALMEVYRVLTCGGILLLTTPNASISLADWRDREHRYSWTTASLEHLLGEIFRIKNMRLVFGGEVIYVEAVKQC